MRNVCSNAIKRLTIMGKNVLQNCLFFLIYLFTFLILPGWEVLSLCFLDLRKVNDFYTFHFFICRTVETSH